MAIKNSRQRLGLTQLELAQKVNVAPNTIWRIENKKANPSIRLLQLLAKALNCTVDELLSDEEVQPKQEEDRTVPTNIADLLKVDEWASKERGQRSRVFLGVREE